MNQDLRIIDVSKESDSAVVAETITTAVRERHQVEVRAIGSAAVGRAIHALVKARTNLSRDGIVIVFTPSFAEVEVEGLATTEVRMRVKVISDSQS